MRYLLLLIAAITFSSCYPTYYITEHPEVVDPLYEEEYTVVPDYTDSYYSTNTFFIRYNYPYLVYSQTYYWNPCGHNYHSYYYNGMCSYYYGGYNGFYGNNYNIYAGWYGYYGYNGCNHYGHYGYGGHHNNWGWNNGYNNGYGNGYYNGYHNGFNNGYYGHRYGKKPNSLISRIGTKSIKKDSKVITKSPDRIVTGTANENNNYYRTTPDFIREREDRKANNKTKTRNIYDNRNGRQQAPNRFRQQRTPTRQFTPPRVINKAPSRTQSQPRNNNSGNKRATSPKKKK